MKKCPTLMLIMAILLLTSSLLIGGCQKSQAPKAEPNNPTAEKESEESNVSQDFTLYFSDNQAMYLIAENRAVEVPKNADQVFLLETAVKQLIAGPKNQDLTATLPPETRLLSVKVDNGTAIVDFSQELQTKHWGGSTGEIMSLGSLTNTLTEFQGIQSVQILLEGQKIDSLLGHMDTSSPLQRDESLIK